RAHPVDKCDRVLSHVEPESAGSIHKWRFVMANLTVRRGEMAPTRRMQSMWDAPERMMRHLLRWDPFREIMPMPMGEHELHFMPEFDVKETKDNFQIKADVPGLTEKDLTITVADNRLTVMGTREEEKEEEGETFYTMERTYGTFTRTFTLPAGADT